MTIHSKGPDVVDLTDIDRFVRSEHHAMLAELRERDELHWNPLGDGGGFWALTRYDEVASAYLDHTSLSSAGGAMLGGSFRSEADTAANRMLVASDPPRHRLLRQQMHPIFSASVGELAAAQIAVLLDDAFDRMLEAGGGDFAQDVAVQLPAGALMAMLDIGHSDAVHLVQLTRRMIGFRDPHYVKDGADERLQLASVQSEIFGFFEDLIDDRGAREGDDVVSVLLRARVNGRPLSHEDVLYNCMNVAVGGNETSSYSACAGIEALMRNPQQYDRLLQHAEAPEPLLDEILRWSSTNAYVQRIATRDIEIRGSKVRAGDSVTLWNVSANRDETRFADPNAFDIDRAPNKHLTFGTGVHRCIGASLGRAELKVTFDRLVRRRIRFAPDGGPTRLRSNFILGITHLPVVVV